MSIFDKVRDALAGVMDTHGDKVVDGIDKAAALIDDKSGGNHSDKIAGGVEKAKDALGKFNGKSDGVG